MWFCGDIKRRAILLVFAIGLIGYSCGPLFDLRKFELSEIMVKGFAEKNPDHHRLIVTPSEEKMQPFDLAYVGTLTKMLAYVHGADGQGATTGDKWIHFKFDLSDLPANAQIQKATLKLFTQLDPYVHMYIDNTVQLYCGANFVRKTWKWEGKIEDRTIGNYMVFDYKTPCPPAHVPTPLVKKNRFYPVSAGEISSLSRVPTFWFADLSEEELQAHLAESKELRLTLTQALKKRYPPSKTEYFLTYQQDSNTPATAREPGAVYMASSEHQHSEVRPQLCVDYILHKGTSGTAKAIALLAFTNVSGKEGLGFVSKTMADVLKSALMKYKKELHVADRMKLASALKEMAIGMTGAISQSTAAKAGKLAGADYIVVGKYKGTKDKLKYAFRVIETETGEIVAAHVSKGSVKTVIHDAKRIADLIINDLR